jgi:hypothetical protein
VAARLERERQKRGVPLKTLVNDLLRAGLETLRTRRPIREPFTTTGFDLGDSLAGSLDNIEEVLSRVEGESHR